MQRLRLLDFRTSLGPQSVGLCQADVARIGQLVNKAQRRLIMAKEAGDEGFWGTWAEMAFNISIGQQFITTPRGVARLEKMAVCQRPTFVQNQFFEYLDFGNGTMPKVSSACDGGLVTQAYSRNNAVTFTDLTSPPQKLRIRALDTADTDGLHRVLLQGTDSNSNVILSQDTLDQVQGIFVTLDLPFVDAPIQFNTITGIQKDITAGYVTISQVDPVSGAEVLLLTMEPGETTAWYRRYFLNPVPSNCCNIPGQPGNVQVTAIAKLDLVPCVVDTDYLLIQNLEALAEECQSIRYEAMDNPGAKAMAYAHHTRAIGMLNGELVHYLGKEKPAISFAPFGTAHLSHRKIGTLI